MNTKLEGLETNGNGITYVKTKLLEEGDSFQGYLVGKHQDQDDPNKISCLIFQDEGGELFGLNSNYVFINAVNGAGGAKYDSFTVVYGGKKKLNPKAKNASHQWTVEKGSTKIAPDDSAYGATSGPQEVAGL